MKLTPFEHLVVLFVLAAGQVGMTMWTTYPQFMHGLTALTMLFITFWLTYRMVTWVRVPCKRVGAAVRASWPATCRVWGRG